ncbi:hypothetical protein KFK09_015200 [Dendrobium nobile]|uniref:Uncharacterized protein n=1 Tax=Dendrobium nobile TaxID=94219 RepID=A0A8T3B453_DENNO|nr:hypothetical protein KFK09_015200 [Dendrobium nobile]
MRAVTGEVTSSNPISLSKAGAVINRFASSETGARPDVAAYLNRAAIAFNELVAVHREILARRKISHVEEKEGAARDEDNNHWGEKKKKKKKGSYFEGQAGNSILELQGEMGVSRKKKVEGLEEEKLSEERRYSKQNKKKVDRLQEVDGVGLVSGSMHVDRKKRKHSDFEQREVNGEMKHEEGKRKKKRRTIE